MNMQIGGSAVDNCGTNKQTLGAEPINWIARISAYKSENDLRGYFETALTLALFAVAWFGAWFALQYSVILGLLLTIPAGGLLVRLFAIQHDCGHGSLFGKKAINDWIGRSLGILTLTPYEYWRHSHALHHASSGNLDRRGFGDIDTITVEEYNALTFWGRLRYRAYRHPIVLFGVGPAYVFFLKQRLPFEMLGKGAKPWLSTLGTNLFVALVSTAMIYFIGWKDFLIIQIPVVLVAASAGVWLFYVQHQFEDTRWDRHKDWKRENAALYGSSFYDLPKPLMWLSGYIGIHHVHHLSASVPFHTLPKIIRDYPELRQIGRLTLLESIKCVPLALWDEASREMISFRKLRRRQLATA
jgi:omega-6 fatty acid desaturase (delta-12 desaturase)